MNSNQLEQNLEVRAQLFKALGHPARLLILNLVRIKPRHGEELATILRLKPATISHHLSKLTEVGLLVAQKDQYYQTYSLIKGTLNKTLDDMIRMPQPELSSGVEADAYRDKVLKTFFKRGRLTQIPAQLKKRQIILARIAEEFEPGREYSEREVNFILLEFHEDVASLRRGLVAEGLMQRDHGIYLRPIEE